MLTMSLAMVLPFKQMQAQALNTSVVQLHKRVRWTYQQHWDCSSFLATSFSFIASYATMYTNCADWHASVWQPDTHIMSICNLQQMMPRKKNSERFWALSRMGIVNTISHRSAQTTYF